MSTKMRWLKFLKNMILLSYKNNHYFPIKFQITISSLQIKKISQIYFLKITFHIVFFKSKTQEFQIPILFNKV